MKSFFFRHDRVRRVRLGVGSHLSFDLQCSAGIPEDFHFRD